MVMLKVNVFEIKAKLSEYLDRAASAKRIVSLPSHKRSQSCAQSSTFVRNRDRSALAGARGSRCRLIFDALPRKTRTLGRRRDPGFPRLGKPTWGRPSPADATPPRPRPRRRPNGRS